MESSWAGVKVPWGRVSMVLKMLVKTLAVEQTFCQVFKSVIFLCALRTDFLNCLMICFAVFPSESRPVLASFTSTSSRLFLKLSPSQSCESTLLRQVKRVLSVL